MRTCVVGGISGAVTFLEGVLTSAPQDSIFVDTRYLLGYCQKAWKRVNILRLEHFTVT
ncbi:hypothetical protein [Anabaena azotica]|uniref:Uncharacterized protein n=1 Tax=Anabaena azotica FACHB-119 TaxID=947527 RepID=A0ABR8DAC2_9NOST|nr:hypothetical protein [Anabaena azotica]MBD2504150.1 hypothetical protein [Anabaena azotica FACHB-119]